MIKISISGEATPEQKQAFDTAMFEAVQSYLGQFPNESVKTNWRKERNPRIVAPVETSVEPSVTQTPLEQ